MSGKEVTRDQINLKLRDIDKEHLESFVIPTMARALRIAQTQAALFVVGSLADMANADYRDIDLHIVPYDSRCAALITAALEKEFVSESRLRTRILRDDEGATGILTGVPSFIFGPFGFGVRGVYFDIFTPFAGITRYESRLAEERASGMPFCVWSENI